MISFKMMWNDVINILTNDNDIDLDIIEKYNTGFTVKEENGTIFITRDDFVDFWCKMLYFNEISTEELRKGKVLKDKYIYSIIKKLPYIHENSGILKIVE